MQIQSSRDQLFSRYATRFYTVKLSTHIHQCCNLHSKIWWNCSRVLSLWASFPGGLVFLCWTEIRFASPLFPPAAPAGKVSELSLERLPLLLPHPNQEVGASSSPLPELEEKHPHLNIPYPLPESSVTGYKGQASATAYATFLQDTSRGRSPANLSR